MDARDVPCTCITHETMKDLSQDIYTYIFVQVCVDIKKDKVPTIL